MAQHPHSYFAILPGLLLPSPPALSTPNGICSHCLGWGPLGHGKQVGMAAPLPGEEEEAEMGIRTPFCIFPWYPSLTEALDKN